MQPEIPRRFSPSKNSSVGTAPEIGQIKILVHEGDNAKDWQSGGAKGD